MSIRNIAAVTFLVLGSTIWPACSGGAVAVTDLPDPAADDRPAGSPPELPRIAVDFPQNAPGAPTRVLSQGEDLQSALNDAKPGDVIALSAGAVFSGPFTLPVKRGDDWITIETTASTLPPSGTRVSPAEAPLMPIIESESGTAMQTSPGAHHYRFIGVQFRPKPGNFLYSLIQLGSDETSVDDLPHHIVFERCYIHGDRDVGGRRGIALNSSYTAVIDSYVADFKEDGADSQALAGWNGAGPFAIVNNYLEAAGENVIFGGADPAIFNLVPSDIVIEGNDLAKPVAWKTNPSHWTVKNLFELKNARRVLVEHNRFAYNWPNAQNGYAILFTPRNQDGNSPWSMVRDVTFRYNVISHVSSGINMQGTDDIHPSQQTKRILILNNVFEDINATTWGGVGNLMQITNGAADVTFDHNTAFQTGAVLVASGDPPTAPFTFTNNLAPNNATGVGGDWYYGNPSGALKKYFPGSVFRKNVLEGGRSTDYPPDNFFPDSIAEIGFVNYTAGDYRLISTSPFKDAGTDGSDIGANIAALQEAPPRRRAVSPHS